jgi:hypothetical protein
VQLSDSTSTTSSVLAATPTAVKSAYDLAAAAVPKSTVTTAGDIIYGTGSAAVTRLALGTAGKVLTVNAGATAPEWATAAGGGGMTLIATATPSAATSLAFTSIPGTYKHLLVIWRNVFQSASGVGWSFRLNNSSASVYTDSTVYNNGSGFELNVNSAANLAGLDVDVIPSTSTSGSVISQTSSGSIQIFRYAELEPRYYTFRSNGYNSSGTRYRDAMGIFNSSSAAVSSIDFIRNSTQSITGTFYLYGVS